MKRFYCAKCLRVVRARSLPRDAHKDASGDMIGTCKHHPRERRMIWIDTPTKLGFKKVTWTEEKRWAEAQARKEVS